MILRFRFGNSWDWFLGDDEHVRGRLRIDVIEGENKVVLVNDLCRDFASNDFLEERHAALHDHECELGLLLVLGNDVTQVFNNLVVEFLAAWTPLLGAGEFAYGLAQAFHAKQFRFAVEVSVNLISQCAEENHLQSFTDLVCEIMQIRFSGIGIGTVAFLTGCHDLEPEPAQNALKCHCEFADRNGVSSEINLEMKQYRLRRLGDHMWLKFMGGISEEFHRYVLGGARDGLAVQGFKNQAIGM